MVIANPEEISRRIPSGLSPRPEKEKPPELGLGEVYSHLFPGSSLENLPKGGILDRLRKHVRAYVNEQGLRESRFIVALENGNSFAERVDLKDFSQYTIACIIQELRPIEAETRGDRFKNNDISDLVNTQLGESLGGAAEKLVIEGGPGMRMASRMLGQDPHYKKPCTVIGVLDSEGKPSGLIYFGEGDQPREPVRRRVGKSTVILAPQPI